MNQKSDTSRAPILVAGATGDIGAQVLANLVGADVPVRALHRRPEQAAPLAQAGARPVRADLSDPESMQQAARGCDRMFLISPPVPGQAALEIGALEAAERAGVTHVVRISAGDSNLRTTVPWAQAHAVVDHFLAHTSLSWTVLRPAAFMQNFIAQATTIRHGFLPQTTGRGEVSWIDTADVAAVAAAVLTHEGHDRATYFLTGPESLSLSEVARRFSHRLGRTVRYVHLPGRIYQTMLRASGQSAFTARGLREQFAHVIRGNLDIDTTSEVPRLLDRPARTLDHWINDNVEIFR